ncbi:hypothetical protein [Faecalibacter sp. LW9]|uniref:hypothetical protein n=1 Tax=Faecalibacter sp. LW9 TaxID=3103144 RepID=UPI002AFE5E25|nr:hypothetical protein [Faecalibacter sp. LW9]
MIKIIQLLMLLITCGVYAQSVDLVGNVIVDNVDEEFNRSGIYVFNEKSNQHVVTSSEGGFQIQVKLDDVLIFKSDFTQTRSIKISQNIIEKGYINVHLDVEMINLAEANLRPLKPNLKDNLAKSETDEYKLKKSLGYDTDEFRKAMATKHNDQKVRNTIAQTGGVNLIGIAKMFIKDKSPKQPQKMNYEVIDEIKSYFTENYFINDLNIPEKRVTDFIGYCFKKYNHRGMFEQQKITEMLMHYEQAAPEFIRLIAKQPS